MSIKSTGNITQECKDINLSKYLTVKCCFKPKNSLFSKLHITPQNTLINSNNRFQTFLKFCILVYDITMFASSNKLARKMHFQKTLLCLNILPHGEYLWQKVILYPIYFTCHACCPCVPLFNVLGQYSVQNSREPKECWPSHRLVRSTRTLRSRPERQVCPKLI